MKSMKISQITFLVFLGFFAVSCGGIKVKNVVEKRAIAVSGPEKTKPVLFKKVVVKMRRGASIGSWSMGLLCVNQGTVKWRGGRVNVTSDDFTDVFQEEFRRNNYSVVGDTNALFGDPSASKAELVIAGLVRTIQTRVCFPMSGFGNFDSSKGEAYIKVNWQIYSRLDRKVVYKVTTEGSSKESTASSGGADNLLLNAFAVATQNLLADRNFHKLVSIKKNTSSRKRKDPMLNIIKERVGYSEREYHH